MVNSFSKILEIEISNASSYRKVYETLISSLSSSPSYITINNVHTVVEGVVNKKYREVINHSFLALPDGKPLSLVAKLKGEKNISRIFGPTFIEKTIEWGKKDSIKHFLWQQRRKHLKFLKTYRTS